MRTTHQLSFFTQIHPNVSHQNCFFCHPKVLHFSVERSFHESINSSLTKDVEPITEWTNLPAFPRNSEIIAAFLTDSMEIEEAASDILSDIIAPPQFSPVALAIKTGQDANKQPHLEIIQLRTRDKIIVFQVKLKIIILSHLLIRTSGFRTHFTE
jgi:hypothetical protein